MYGESGAESSSDGKADRILTHPFWGVPVFLVILAAVFFLTFTVGDFLKGYFELGLEGISGLVRHGLEAIGTAGWLKSLIVDGIIAGVGGILTFLPNIFILFLALAFLEDSGYMARVAYVMDGIMGKVWSFRKGISSDGSGLRLYCSGGYGNRERWKVEQDRKRTILITPFMSCSARLPDLCAVCQCVFRKICHDRRRILLYVIGVLVAIVIAHGRQPDAVPKALEHALLIELPEYKTPNAQDNCQSMYGRR